VVARKHGAGLDQFGPCLRKIVAIDGLQPRDLLVLVGDQRRPVERDRAYAPAERAGVFELLGKLRSVDEQLLGNTPSDDTRATDTISVRAA
jgi:hypothetical protein